MAWWDKVQPGDKLRIPAAAWNALMDALQSRDNLAGGGPLGGSRDTVLVRNETGGDVDRFGVIGLGDPIVLPAENENEFKSGIAIRGVPPEENKPFGIALEPIANGKIGTAQVAGAVITRVVLDPQIQDAEKLEYAEPAQGSVTALRVSRTGSVRILWKEESGEARWAVVHIGYRTPILYRTVLQGWLAPCGNTQANILSGDGCTAEKEIMIYDSLGVAPAMGLPPGTACWAVWALDERRYELVSYGWGCCSSGSSSLHPPSSSASSSASHSSSASSSHSSSSSSQSSASGSSASSSGSGSSVSSGGSSGSMSSISQSQPPSESWSGSDKSSAIVPASWSPTGYVALFIHEMPEVRFDDVMIVQVPQEDHEIAIDPRFVEVCERGTIEVCGIACDKPIAVGARAVTDRVRLRFAEQDPEHAVRLVIRLTGIRRGFAGKRFPRRTREQFLANEAFINSAYPSDPRAE